MTVPEPVRDELFDLLWSINDGKFSPGDVARLEELVALHPEASQLYAQYSVMCGLLTWERKNNPAVHSNREAGFSTVDSSVDDKVSPFGEYPAVAEGEPSCRDPFSISTQTPYSTSQFVGGPVFSYMVATVALCAMLLGAWAYKISHSELDVVDENTRQSTPYNTGSEREFVGRITNMKDCRWGENAMPSITGAHVPLKRKYELASGLLEITYDSGARVILEGPCEYEVNSTAGGRLQLGKLVARVEKREERREKRRVADAKLQAANSQSLIPNPQSLFCITTPTAVVTDLGTEFGVEVDTDGNTTSCVFRGSVKVEAGTEESVVLRADESVRIEKMSRVRETHHESTLDEKVCFTHPTTTPKFVRRVTEPPKRIDLLDIVAGGNGLRVQRERGIDPSTGKQDPFFMITEYASDGEYRSVAFNKLIDGVFIPVANGLNVRIDSAGHTYDGFGRNAGKTVGSIWARSADVSRYNQDRNRFDWVYSIGDGSEFMPERRGLLCLHANVGITFDLAAVRKSHPDARPKLFRSTAGMGDTSGVHPDTDPYSVDFRVFVDGVVKYERKAHTRPDGVLKIKVELGPEARFLTLAVTDNDGRCAYDWSVFGDPVLEMVPLGDTNQQGVELPKGGRRSD